MHILCKYTGTYYEVPGFTSHKIVDRHPIFSFPTYQLTSMAKDWAAGKMSAEDSKLLFVALLSRLENIKFTSIADPSPSIVAQNMERLIKLVDWTSQLDPGTIDFPAYRITEQNTTLSNINHLITEWYDCRRDWATSSDRRALGDKLEKREQVLSKLIEDGVKSTNDYSNKLASWAMDAASVPTSLRELWTEFFNLKEPTVYQANLEDFEKMKSFMDSTLMLGNSYAQGSGFKYSYAVLTHLRNLHEQIKDGPLASLKGGMTFTIIDTDGTSREVENIESLNAKAISHSAPKMEPKQKDYPKLIDYLRAKAAWTVAQGVKDQLKLTEAEAASRIVTIVTSLPATAEDAHTSQMGL